MHFVQSVVHLKVIIFFFSPTNANICDTNFEKKAVKNIYKKLLKHFLLYWLQHLKCLVKTFLEKSDVQFFIQYDPTEDVNYLFLSILEGERLQTKLCLVILIFNNIMIKYLNKPIIWGKGHLRELFYQSSKGHWIVIVFLNIFKHLIMKRLNRGGII